MQLAFSFHDTMSATQLPHPRWVNLLRETVNTNMKLSKDAITYAIATLDDGVTSPAALSPAPRVRYVVHRGFVNERRPGEDPTWSGKRDRSSSHVGKSFLTRVSRRESYQRRFG